MRTFQLPLLVAVVSIPLLGVPGTAAELSGRVSLLEGNGGSRSPEVTNAVVYFTPKAARREKPPAEPTEVVTVRKEFTPRVVAVPVGSRVRFPNQDPILHNIFSVSTPRKFDLGLYRQGEGKEVTFDQPGVVQVFCNVHHSMVAYVVVLETPYFAYPDRSGAFRLEGLSEGAGVLTVWHERADPWQQELSLPVGAPLEINIKISKPRVPKHLNKLGKPYPRSSRDKAYG